MVWRLAIACCVLTVTAGSSLAVLPDGPGQQVGHQAQVESTGSDSIGDLNLLMDGGFEGAGSWENAYDGPSPSGRRPWRVVDGGWSLWINDTDPSSGEGWRSAAAAVSGGVRYLARAEVYRLEGQAPHLYIKYFDGSGAEIASQSVTAAGPPAAWQVVETELPAPAGAVAARVVAYSSAGRVGISYFDNVVLSRQQSAIDNEGFQLDPVRPGQPTGWMPWGGATEPVAVAADPFDPANRTLRLEDGSTTEPAASAAEFAADGGIEYVASARVLLDAGSDQVALMAAYFDAGGNQIGSFVGESPAPTGGWASLSLTSIAPPGTVSGQVVAHCSIPRRCSARFDDVRVQEVWHETRYVAAAPAGDGSGSSAANPARYHDPAFWSGVQQALGSAPVRVVFRPGSYPIASSQDRLVLRGMGHQQHRLQLVSEEVYGTVLRATGSFEAQMMTLIDSTNLTISNLHFTGADAAQVRAALLVTANQRHLRSIVVEGIQVVDLPGAEFAGLSLSAPAGGTISGIRAAHNGFIRAGRAGGYHHIYATHGLAGLIVTTSYFEDSAGTYVKLRANIDQAAVTDSLFHNTGTWSTNNTPLVQLAVYNDVSPGDEWFGSGYRIVRNQFVYADPASCARDACHTLNITHQGYNPVDDRDAERDHLLDAAKKAVMSDLSSANIQRRRAILAQDFHLRANDCDAGVCLDANRFAGETRRFILYTTHNYGALDQGGSGTYDISNLLTN